MGGNSGYINQTGNLLSPYTDSSQQDSNNTSAVTADTSQIKGDGNISIALAGASVSGGLWIGSPNNNTGSFNTPTPTYSQQFGYGGTGRVDSGSGTPFVDAEWFGLPWYYWLGGLFILGGVFYYRRRG